MTNSRVPKHSVIARLDRAIQYAAAVVLLTMAGVYWMPAGAGMTGARGKT
jgi:hypothetical protein